jgi:hypothetical protein
VTRPRTRLAVRALAAAAFLAPGGAGAAPPAPPRLSGTGLWADPDARTIADGVLAFSPQYPLWTDGAAKRRFIRLPPGAAIDASDPDRWSFPPGTRVWKEFSFGRRVETRYMERGADGTWTYATYLWTPDGGDAVLAPARGLRAQLVLPGLRHDLPGVEDCKACHEGGLSPVLGFSALQLSPDRDPLAPHADPPGATWVDLAWLAARGLVRGLPAGSAAAAPRVSAPTARGRAALGYLHGNCASCHNTRGPLASLGLDLEQRTASAPRRVLPTAVGAPSRFQLPGEEAWLRIAPGSPERSVLQHRISTRNPIAQMPPLGSYAVDEEARALVERWIREDLAAPLRAAAAVPNPRAAVDPRRAASQPRSTHP